MISLSDISRDLDQLEMLPVSHTRLANAAVDPEVGLREISKIIEYDPAMTANTLKLANSSYYATGSPIQTVQQAVTKLGAGRILELIVGNRIRERMTAPCRGYQLQENELWRHSIAAAVAASHLPQFASTPIPPVVFTAALLHDIGKLVLSRYLDNEIQSELRRIMEQNRLAYVEAERAVLGFNHAQVGGVVARRWQFPELLAECIAYHHHPRECGNSKPALDAVHISNAVAKMIGTGFGSEEMNMSVCTESACALGLTPSKLEALCASTAQELPSVLALYEDETHAAQRSYC